MKKFLTPLAGVAALGAAGTLFAAAAPVTDLEVPAVGKTSDKVYLVKVLEREAALQATGAKNADSPEVQAFVAENEALHSRILNEAGAATDTKVYSYNFATNGFAARLNTSQVARLKLRSDVAVYEDVMMVPQTVSSPQFLGLTERGQVWTRGWTGEDVVIGIVDTGINPEHPSFADVETPIRGSRGRLRPYGDVPESYVGESCEFGNTAFNPLDAEFSCNNKLIGAKYFVDGFGVERLIEGEFLSARDFDGHGSHVAGTAGGNFGVPATFGGVYVGDASGIAPRARIAAYKVCWTSFEDRNNDGQPDGGCFGSDTMAAIDQAVADGVDVINYSIGGPSTFFGDETAIAFLNAADAGVFVATSQGNSGPLPGTTGTPSGVPWITSVAATQDDEVFSTALEVSAPEALAGSVVAVEGAGPVTLEIAGDIGSDLALADPIEACGPLANAEAVADKIALVRRGSCGFITKYLSAQEAGARAIVVFNDGTAPDRMNPFVMGGLDDTVTIPGVMVPYMQGADLADAMVAGDTVAALLSPSIQDSRVDRIADFSSRGPNNGAPDIIKPDIAAPGVQILAAGPSNLASAPTGETFINISGTSMSSPHVAGLFALLKQAHPEWTPAMARSALMTTARSNIQKTFADAPADPFDIGAGFVQPQAAFNPGLVYDAGLNDYYAFSCDNNAPLVDLDTCIELENQGYSTDASNLNLPSIGIAELTGLQVIKRTVTSVARGTRLFTMSYEAPEGIEMVAWPERLKLAEGESADYYVAFKTAPDADMGAWAFGSLTWTWGGGRYEVKSPIAVRPIPFFAPDSFSGKSESGEETLNVVFGYDGAFSASAEGLVEPTALENLIEDGGANQSDAFIIEEGTTFARFTMSAADVGDGSGSDDLDIVVFGPDTEGFPEVGRSETASSNETVDVENPAPGLYIVVVVDFSSAEGPTPYVVKNFALSESASGNMTVSAPDSAAVGTLGQVTVEWDGLMPASEYLGRIVYRNGERVIGTTEVTVDTQ